MSDGDGFNNNLVEYIVMLHWSQRCKVLS